MDAIQITYRGEHPSILPRQYESSSVFVQVVPRIGETVILDGLAFIVSDVIHHPRTNPLTSGVVVELGERT